MKPIYLDYNASSPLHPKARAAMLEVLDLPGNAHSLHRVGQRAFELVEAARRQLGDVLGVAPTRIVFTSGATEANALAMHGPRRWLASAAEHPSVLAWAAGTTAVDRNGVAVEPTESADGYAIMLANNETGVIQPIADARRWATNRGARLHVDATQGLGRMRLPGELWTADSVSLSAHKFGGPQGVGALVVRESEDEPKLKALLRGGPQERGRRAGTLNLAGIVGMAAAAEVADTDNRALRGLRDALDAGLRGLGGQIVGEQAARLDNTSCVAFSDMDAADLVMALDLSGVQVSAGAACASGAAERSHVLRAMGIAGSAIRLSMGFGTTSADVTDALNALARILPLKEVK
jgi:cysteine desulfurase